MKSPTHAKLSKVTVELQQEEWNSFYEGTVVSKGLSVISDKNNEWLNVTITYVGKLYKISE